jgi:hypothetical protein
VDRCGKLRRRDGSLDQEGVSLVVFHDKHVADSGRSRDFSLGG